MIEGVPTQQAVIDLSQRHRTSRFMYHLLVVQLQVIDYPRVH